MCIYQKFFFLCGCDKLKISKPCEQTSTNVQGQVFCRKDPHPHIDDGAERLYDFAAHGPGVCSNIRCKWQWGILPLGVYEAEDWTSLLENDASFDMSDEACEDREARWFRMLTTDQQLECLPLSFPLPAEKMSLCAQAYFSPDPVHGMSVFFSRYDELSTDQLHHSELNPRYMNAEQLRFATGFLLPAEVTLPGESLVRGSTPQKPLVGPFKVRQHDCKPVPGLCDVCGRNAGEPRAKREQMLSEAENVMFWRECWPRPHETAAGFEKIFRGMEQAQSKQGVVEATENKPGAVPDCEADVFKPDESPNVSHEPDSGVELGLDMEIDFDI